jgi:hypothetical protein
MTLPSWPARRWAVRPRTREEFDPKREYVALKDLPMVDGTIIKMDQTFPKDTVPVRTLRNLYFARWLRMAPVPASMGEVSGGNVGGNAEAHSRIERRKRIHIEE